MSRSLAAHPDPSTLPCIAGPSIAERTAFPALTATASTARRNLLELLDRADVSGRYLLTEDDLYYAEVAIEELTDELQQAIDHVRRP